jgi:hypothetical protein
VNTTFEFHDTERTLTAHFSRDLGKTTNVTLVRVDHLERELQRLAVTLVHAQQIRREQPRFRTTCARANLENHITRIGGVFGQRQFLEFGLETRQFGLIPASRRTCAELECTPRRPT